MEKIRPVRLQLSRRKGFKLQEHSRAVNGLECVNCARPSPYSNPHRIGPECDRETSLRRFRSAWEEALKSSRTHPRHPPMPFGEPVFLGPLKQKNLACWCKPGDPCHADVLLEIANTAPPAGEGER